MAGDRPHPIATVAMAAKVNSVRARGYGFDELMGNF
jgi:hypothetical protein